MRGFKWGMLALVLAVSTASVCQANSVKALWGIDPSNSQALVNFNPWTGAEIQRFAVSPISATDTEIGLAGWQNELFYVNSNQGSANVFVINPNDGSLIRQFSISGGWEVDGLGYYKDATAGSFLYTSGCSVTDMHRYVATNGSSPQFFWGNIDVQNAVGGDYGGRIFAPVLGQQQIVEVNPLVDASVKVMNCPFASSIVGMAYDGVYLYASTTDGKVRIMDSDTASVLNVVQMPYTLYALGSTEGTETPQPPVPEPITMIGLVLGIGGMAGYLRKRRMA